MAKSAAPLLLLVGGAALLMTGKKKKKKSTGEATSIYDDLPDDTGFDEEEPDLYIPPAPVQKPPSPSRPSGNPPNGDSYDGAYWGGNTEERLISIRQHFRDLGYNVEVGPWPMNNLGPKGTVEMENKDGSKGKLGGEDDEKSAVVLDFQGNYNQVSKLNKAEKVFSANMGGLNKDGLVGPYVLNGLRYAVGQINAGLSQGKKWQDLVQMAVLKGINS